jgi:hypothetical protein
MLLADRKSQILAKLDLDAHLPIKVYEFFINVVSSGNYSTDWTTVRSTARKKTLGPEELAICFR